MHQADNSLTNHAAGKHVENSICMFCSKNPEINAIKNESLNKLIYLSEAILHFSYVVSSRSSYQDSRLISSLQNGQMYVSDLSICNQGANNLANGSKNERK